MLDGLLTARDLDAFMTACRLARREPFRAAIPVATLAHAARHMAARPKMPGALVVALLADTGERYITSLLFDA